MTGRDHDKAVQIKPLLQHNQADQPDYASAVPATLVQFAQATHTDEVSEPVLVPVPVKPKPIAPAEPIDPVLLFDEELNQALIRFQAQHGLAADGVVGPATLAALNVSLKQRVRQIALNMERWRRYPRHLGKRYLMVNVASYSLDVMEDGESVLHMRTVVGQKRKRWRTPVFSDSMEYVVLNPNWYIPPSIAKREILPR